jgi:hypothetical protein
MANYIFLPVVSSEMTGMATTVAAFLDNAKILKNVHVSGWKKGYERHFGTGCLAGVRDNDSLFVLLHGAGYAGSKQIGAKRDTDGNLKAYDAPNLARVLDQEGLVHTFRDLHMFTCGSGLMNKNAIANGLQVRDPKLNPKYQAHESIARQMSNEMKKKGFRVVRVTGYLGDIVVRPPNRVTIEDSVSGQEFGLDWKVVCA